MEYSPAYAFMTQACVLASGFITSGLIIYIVNFLNVAVISVFSRSTLVLILSNAFILTGFAIGQFILLDWVMSLFTPQGLGYAMGVAGIMCAIVAIGGLIINVYLHFRRHRHARDTYSTRAM